MKQRLKGDEGVEIRAFPAEETAWANALESRRDLGLLGELKEVSVDTRRRQRRGPEGEAEVR